MQSMTLKWFFLLSYIYVISGMYEQEKRLYDDLLAKYKPSIRPARREDEPVKVEFQIQILKLRSYDLKEQVLTVTAFTMMHWMDPQLTWNETEYGGKKRINLDNSEIWTPDIVLYNSAYEERESWKDTYPSKTIVMSNGLVIWNMPVIWYVACQSDITWFPVDEQTCTMQFGSWSYSKSQFQIIPWKRNHTEDDSRSVPNGEWEIKRVEKTYDNLSFQCCPEAFSAVRYTIVFDHLPNFYFVYIILPMAALVFMFPLVFIIPVDSGERLGFGVTVILSITVYLLVISDKLPEKSDVPPMLGIVFVGEFFLLVFGLMIATLSMTIYSNKKVGPNFLRRLARVAAKQQNTGKVEYPKAEVTNSGYDSDQEDKPKVPRMLKCKSHGLTTERRPPDVKLYKEEWEILSTFLDCFGFFFTYGMIILFPIIVYIALPKSGLHS